MHSRAKVITLTRDTKQQKTESREIYFDKDVFTLLDPQDVLGNEEWLYKSVSASLRQIVFKSLPLYISRIMYIADSKDPNFGQYKVLYTDGTKVGYFHVDLSKLSEEFDVNIVEKTSIKEPTVDDISLYPDNINPHRDYNETIFYKTLPEYILDLKQRQSRVREKFWKAETDLISPRPLPPKISTRTYTEDDYSLYQAASLAQPILTPLIIAKEGFEAADEAFTQFTGEVKDKLHDLTREEQSRYSKVFFQGIDEDSRDKLAVLRRELSTDVNLGLASTVNAVNKELKDIWVLHRNMQETFSSLKNALAYAIYKAAYDYYQEEIQKATLHKPELRKERVENFNRRFEPLGIHVTQDGPLSDISLVYQKMQSLYLSDIQTFMNKILRNGESGNRNEGLDSVIIFNSAMLEKMLEALNLAADSLDQTIKINIETLIGGANSEIPMFKAVGKTWDRKKIIAPAEFKWREDLLAYEKKIKDQLDKSKRDVQTLITPKLLQQATITHNLVLDETNGLVTKQANFSSYMTDYNQARKHWFSSKEIKEAADQSNNIWHQQIAKLVASIKKLKEFNNSATTQVTSEIEAELKLIQDDHKKIRDSIITLSDQIDRKFHSLQSLTSSFDYNARKKLVSEINDDIENLSEKSKTLHSTAHGISLKYRLSKIEQQIDDLMQPIKEQEERRDHPKIFIQKRINKLLLDIETHRRETYGRVESDEVLEQLEQERVSKIEFINSLKEKYAKQDTTADHVEKHIIELDDAFNRIIDIDNEISEGLKRRKLLMQLKKQLEFFDPNGIGKKTLEDHRKLVEVNVSEIKEMGIGLTPEEIQQLTTYQQDFHSSERFLTDIHTELTTGPLFENLLDIYSTEVNVDRHSQLYYLSLNLIVNFKDYIKLKKDIELVRSKIPSDENLKPALNEFHNDAVLQNLIKKYEAAKKHLNDMTEKYKTTSLEEIMAKGISLKTENIDMIRTSEQIFYLRDALEARLELLKFNRDVVQPNISHFDENIQFLKSMQPTEASKTLISQYEACQNQLATYLQELNTADPQIELDSIQKARNQLESLFKNACQVYANLDLQLAYEHVSSAKFQQSIRPVETFRSGQKISAELLIRHHRLITGLINDLERKYKPYMEKYRSVPIQAWPKEIKAMLDTSYKLRKQRYEIEMAFKAHDIQAYRETIIAKELEISKSREKLRTLSRKDKKLEKDKIKNAQKELDDAKKRLNLSIDKFHTDVSASTVDLNFYQHQVQQTLSLMQNLNTGFVYAVSSLPKKDKRQIHEWLLVLRRNFTGLVTPLLSPLAEKKASEKKNEVARDILPVEAPRVDGQDVERQDNDNVKEPISHHGNKLVQSFSGEAIFDFDFDTIMKDIEEIESSLPEAEKEEEKNQTSIEDNTVRIFQQIDMIMWQDPMYELQMQGGENYFDYYPFINQLKEKVLFDHESLPTFLIHAYKHETIGLETFLRLNEILSNNKDAEFISLADLDHALKHYDEHKGIMRRIFGPTRTIADLQQLRDMVYKRELENYVATLTPGQKDEIKREQEAFKRLPKNEQKAKGKDWSALEDRFKAVKKDFKEIKISGKNLELIIQLRDKRKALLRSGSYKHRGMFLFSRSASADKPEYKMSATEATLNELRIRKKSAS